jgi:hypothetical protein
MRGELEPHAASPTPTTKASVSAIVVADNAERPAKRLVWRAFHMPFDYHGFAGLFMVVPSRFCHGTVMGFLTFQ